MPILTVGASHHWVSWACAIKYKVQLRVTEKIGKHPLEGDERVSEVLHPLPSMKIHAELWQMVFSGGVGTASSGSII